MTDVVAKGLTNALALPDWSPVRFYASSTSLLAHLIAQLAVVDGSKKQDKIGKIFIKDAPRKKSLKIWRESILKGKIKPEFLHCSLKH